MGNDRVPGWQKRGLLLLLKVFLTAGVILSVLYGAGIVMSLL